MTDLATFLGKSSKPDLTTPAATGGYKQTADAVVAESQEVALASQVKDVTPSGIEVMYQASPKRLYRVNGVEVPSVTSVLDCLSKDGLPWWGMKVGVGGVLDLFKKGALATAFDWDTDSERVVLNENYADVDSIVTLLTEHQLTVNHQRDKAADRGTNVHDALEQWGRSGGEFFPTPQNFPGEERPYVEALLKWIDDTQASPRLCEVMVGSVEHGFAGRYDLTVEMEEREVVVHCGLKRGPKKETIPGGRLLVDLKTSSGVYPTSHFRQLAAYELASVECGYPTTDAQYVLHVTKNGEYEFIHSNAVADDFLAALRTWQSNQRLKGKS